MAHPLTQGLARRDLLLLALAAACWGLGTVVSKRAIGEMSPLVLFPIQLTSSLVALGLLMRHAGLPLLGSPRLLGRLGLLNPGLAYALGLIGLTYISASLYLLLWALEPLLILLLAGIFLDEGITRRLVLLSAMAAAGMALVVYDGSTSGQLLGVVLVLAGVACCAAYTVIARRWVATSDSTAQVVLAQQAYALGLAVLVALASGLIGGGLRWSGVSTTAIASAVASGLLYYTAAYWFYLSALRMVPASLAATSFYLIPVFGVSASFAVLGERLDVGQWVGVGIVVVAILSIIRLPGVERRPRGRNPLRTSSRDKTPLTQSVFANLPRGAALFAGIRWCSLAAWQTARPPFGLRVQSGCPGRPRRAGRMSPDRGVGGPETGRR